MSKLLDNFWDLSEQEYRICSPSGARLKSWKGSAKLHTIFYFFDKNMPVDNISVSEGGLHDNDTLKTPMRFKRYV